MPPKSAAAKKVEAVPTLIEIKVGYAVGVKANLDTRDGNGNQIKTYESADYHFSHSETYAIPEGMDHAAVSEFRDERMAVLREDLDGKMMEAYADASFYVERD